MSSVISERQGEIIEAAGKILSSGGVGGLTIKNLAKEMQFSESAIYRHFSSKEDIIVAMLSYLADNMDERFSNALKTDQNPDQQFIKLFQSQFSYFKTHPQFVVAVFSDGLIDNNERVNAAVTNLMAVMRTHLLPVILNGQKRGEFTKQVKADALLHIVIGTVRLHMFHWRTQNFKPDIKRSGDALIKTLMTLIRTR